MTSEKDKPDICLVHLDSFSLPEFGQFIADVEMEKLRARMVARPDPGAYAGLEWLIPTVVFVFIARSYFDSFLKEAGKDHYQLLKAALPRLSAKFFGKDAPKSRLVFSKGKAKSEDPHYSIYYSIVAEIGGGNSIKLLLQAEFDAEQCNKAQEAFLAFLSDVFDGSLDLNSVRGLADAKPVGGVLLLAYDLESGCLEVVDPVPRSKLPSN